MKVFISWSGIRSKMLAEALREFLPLVIQRVEPFMSKNDIEAGSHWALELNKQLEATDTAIICLTPENRKAEWIHYEAGALAKRLERTRICVCRSNLDTAQVVGPLSQFQSKATDKEDIRSIVSSVNNATEEKLTPDSLKQSFEAFWPTLEAKIKAIPTEAPADVPPERDQAAMISEVLEIVRGLARKGSSTASSEVANLDRLNDPRNKVAPLEWLKPAGR